MDIRPILSALLRNRTGAVLVGMQVAITLAVIANALFIIERRIQKIDRPTGIDTPNLIFVQSYGFAPDYDQEATRAADLALIRAMPGVIAATPINSVPLSGEGSASGYYTKPGDELTFGSGNSFNVDETFIQAPGLKLVAGRAFRPEEFIAKPLDDKISKESIVSIDMAKLLFGDSPAVGKLVYDTTGEPSEIVGVVSNMLGSWLDSTRPKPTEIVFLPLGQPGQLLRYVVRTRAGDRDRLIPELEKKLAASGHGRTITWARPHEHWITRIYQPDHRMVVFLSTLVFLMTAVTALGIVGLATFHVNARRKQIGTRRALGARRRDIIWYFLVENGLLAAAGSVAGALLAYAGSAWLSRLFQQPPLPVGYVLATAAGILLLGQLAVLSPARRAAAIDPGIATRTV